MNNWYLARGSNVLSDKMVTDRQKRGRRCSS